MAAAGSLALAHDALLPRPPGGTAPGAALALLVHAGLLLALTTAVDWRTQAPQVVSAELWASVPQVAAPAAPPPPPPVAPSVAAPQPLPVQAAPPPTVKPPEPDIAIERAAQQKVELARRKAEADAQAERERVAAEKLKRAAADKAAQEQAKAEKLKAAEAARLKAEKVAADKAARESQAEEARLAKQREENLKRMMGQAGGATGRSGTAARDAAPSAAYAGMVAARVRRELNFPGNVPESAETEVFVVTTSSGTVVSRRVTKKSGYPEWDEAVLRAIDKLGTFPRDVDGRVQTEMTLVFKRRD